MDPYDEIVEQLENARAKGLETVKGRLEAILDGLEAASAAVREAMTLEADDLAPLGGIPAAVEELKEAAREAAVVPPPLVHLDLLRELDSARNQSDLLHGLLKALAGQVARAAVLVFRTDAIGAWSAIGFDDAAHLEKWSCERGESPLLDGFVDDPRPRQFDPEDDPVVQRWLDGESKTREALLVPISLRGKTMGAVYVDRLEDRPWNPEAAQILVALSCWMIDTLKYRAAAGSPMLLAIGGVDQGEGAEGIDVELEVEEAEATAVPVEPEREQPPVEDELAAVPEEVEETAEAEASERTEDSSTSHEPSVEGTALDEMAAAPGFDPSATVQVDHDEAQREVEVVVDDFAAEVEAVEDEELEDERIESVEGIDAEVAAAEVGVQVPPPVEPVVPPPDLAEPSDEPGLPGVSPEDESRHEEARRFARLLVSEIKLYNEEAVERGRVQRDLYARLREDIDRSREMFERRIPPEIRATRDYFHEELVRILGDGDSDALGM